MSKKTIKKFIKGDYPPDKQRQISKWILNSPSRINQYKKLKTKHIVSLLNSDNQGNVKNHERGGNKIYIVAAAILFLMASTFFIKHFFINPDELFYDQQKMVVTKKGERKEIFLEDSTKVILNANSKLTVFDFRNSQNRKVILKGEAFFDVKKDKDHPFIVEAKKGVNIRVLGTVLNVKSYPEDSFVETTLVSGKVKIEEKNQRKTIELKPSQKATYFISNKTLVVEEVDVKYLTSWTKGVLFYNETSILKVFEDLERTYNITFDIKSKEILDYKYSGVFDNMTIDEVLDIFKLSSPIKFKKIDNIIIVELENK